MRGSPVTIYPLTFPMRASVWRGFPLLPAQHLPPEGMVHSICVQATFPANTHVARPCTAPRTARSAGFEMMSGLQTGAV